MTSRRPIAASAAAVLAAALLAGPASAAAPTSSWPVAPDGLARAIVVYSGGVTDGILADLTDLGVLRGLELQAIDAVAVTATPEVLAAVVRDERVFTARPQRQLVLDLYESKDQVNALGIGTAEPTTFGGVDFERPGVTGAGVGVAVLDSGIFAAHPDFLGRATTGLHYSFSEIQDSGGISFEQWDNYAEATGPIALQDEIGHGTHVASTVGGSGASSAFAGGPDLAGVAPGVELFSFKVATAPFGIVDDLDWEEAALASFDYIIRHNEELGIRVAQNSWGLLPSEPNCLGFCEDLGETTDFDAMKAMVQATVDAGVTVVFSAGNDGRDGEGTVPIFKGFEAPITTAAACRRSNGACAEGGITDFSSHGLADLTGPQVDIATPGDTIMAAVSPSILLPLTECPDSQQLGYYCISGTSMASPHTAGVAALLYEANPELTPAEVKHCITSTAVDMLEPGYDNLSGHGMVNARAAVDCAIQIDAAEVVVDPAPEPEPTQTPAPEPTPDPLPATGGGKAILGIGLLGSAVALLRGRR